MGCRAVEMTASRFEEMHYDSSSKLDRFNLCGKCTPEKRKAQLRNFHGGKLEETGRKVVSAKSLSSKKMFENVNKFF